MNNTEQKLQVLRAEYIIRVQAGSAATKDLEKKRNNAAPGTPEHLKQLIAVELNKTRTEALQEFVASLDQILQ